MPNNDVSPTPGTPRVLLTGATGYVGSRLLERLEHEDVRVRCLTRHPERLAEDVAASTEVCGGDVLEPDSLGPALEDVDTAYYLIHLMAGGGDFREQDRRAAENFAAAARAAGVRRIIYMGGLGDDSDGSLSPHLRSRQEVGEILRDSGVQTIEFRASVVIGQGSLSFDLIRSLTNRLPVMLCPRWLATATQPIAIGDVLEYLLEARTVSLEGSRVFEIGSSDVVTYGELIKCYARLRGLRRYLISVPLLTPYLSSLWLGLVTPTSAKVGRHLIEGLKNPTIVKDPSAREAFSVRPMGVEAAMRQALENDDAPAA
ncbi:NAD(P)H-binding protein [Roseimaritima sediminicola]|uniref:NAD(P)H-binding protein n=1 Tax=Roseimaritima sediminicola TaxID=2662066 RepID=UPI0012985856|nr:NAD(P)H-binding protein [Roseimaritima sediminicola]